MSVRVDCILRHCHILGSGLLFLICGCVLCLQEDGAPLAQTAEAGRVTVAELGGDADGDGADEDVLDEIDGVPFTFKASCACASALHTREHINSQTCATAHALLISSRSRRWAGRAIARIIR